MGSALSLAAAPSLGRGHGRVSFTHRKPWVWSLALPQEARWSKASETIGVCWPRYLLRPLLQLEPKSATCPKVLQTDLGSINRGPFPHCTKKIPNLQHTIQAPNTCPSQGRHQQLRTASTDHPYMKGKCRGQKRWTGSHHKRKKDHSVETAASHPYRDKNWSSFLAWRTKEDAGWMLTV